MGVYIINIFYRKLTTIFNEIGFGSDCAHSTRKEDVNLACRCSYAFSLYTYLRIFFYDGRLVNDSLAR